MEDTQKYHQILNLPRHISPKHPPMPLNKRAAQFSPYAALVGHQEQVRQTENMINHSQEKLRKSQIILENDQ